MIYVIIYILGWLLAILCHLLHPDTDFTDVLLLTQLVFCVGFFGIFNFIGHTILSEKVAKTIGWESNGFQKELGFVSLGIGVCGILCYWFRGDFWIATAIPFSIFLIGAGGMHIFEIIKKKNYNSGNTLIIFPDFAMPLTLIILLILKYI